MIAPPPFVCLDNRTPPTFGRRVSWSHDVGETTVNQASGWSDVAAEWSALWGSVAEPVWREIVVAASIHPGSRVLDVGCGGGELLAFLAAMGADAQGIDPADDMRALAAARGLAVTPGEAESIPHPDDSFDLVTAINALQFAEDTLDALDEMRRVTRPGGYVAIANWAERERNQLDVLERAIDDEEPAPDGELRLEGGLEALLAEAGFAVTSSGVTEVPWHVRDDDELVRGVMLGEDSAVMAARSRAIIAAARPFRDAAGGYTVVNAFRWAMARVSE